MHRLRKPLRIALGLHAEVWPNFKARSLQNESSLFLNVSIVGASTTALARLFHLSTIRRGSSTSAENPKIKIHFTVLDLFIYLFNCTKFQYNPVDFSSL